MLNIATKTIIRTLLLTTVSLISQTTSAASGQTSVTVSFPEIIILHYRSALGITFTGAADSSIDEQATTISVPLASASGSGSITASGTAATTIPVTVSNMWAVRGITSDGEIEVVASVNSDTADTASGSEAIMSDLEVVSGSLSGPSINVVSAGLAISNAVLGGITFNLDISDVTETGSHTGITYTITATAP